MLWSDLLLSQPFMVWSLWSAIKDCCGLTLQDKHHTSAHSPPPQPKWDGGQIGGIKKVKSVGWDKGSLIGQKRKGK